MLQRIKCKLDGKDRWPGKERESKQSVAEQVGRTLQRVYAAGSSWDFSEGAARPGGVTALRDDDAENHTSTGAAPSSSSKL